MAASSLNITIGALQVGVLLSSMLYGISTAQAYVYSENCKKDPRWMKVVVAGVWILETGHQVLLCYYIYYETVLHFGQEDKIGATPIFLCVSVAVAGLIGMIVQIFFAYRVLLLSRGWLIPTIAWIGATVRLGWAIVCAIYMSKAGSLATFISKYGWMLDVLLGLHITVDTLIAVSSFATLSTHQTQFEATSRIINKLMLYSVETGLITSIFVTVMLVVRIALPHEYIWAGMLMIYAKLYSNTLMASLNKRIQLQQTVSGETATSSGLRAALSISPMQLSLPVSPRASPRVMYQHKVAAMNFQTFPVDPEAQAYSSSENHVH